MAICDCPVPYSFITFAYRILFVSRASNTAYDHIVMYDRNATIVMTAPWPKEVCDEETLSAP